MALMLWVKNWVAEQDGQDLVEYALLLGLIALIAVVAITAGGTAVNKIWLEIQHTLENAVTAVGA